MNKDREPRYFDFIHQHEERLNQIYSRWEAQIDKQNAANKPRSLLGKIGKKKVTLAGMAIAFGSVLLASQCGKVNANKTAIASNSQKINQMSHELGHAAANYRLRSCIGNDDIYQLNSRYRNYHASNYGYGSFIGQLNTIYLTKRSKENELGEELNVRLRVDPNGRLSLGSTENDRDNNMVQTSTRDIDLNLNADDLLDRESINDYREIQEEAIALQEELFQCYVDNGALSKTRPLPHNFYAD